MSERMPAMAFDTPEQANRAAAMDAYIEAQAQVDAAAARRRGAIEAVHEAEGGPGPGAGAPSEAQPPEPPATQVGTAAHGQTQGAPGRTPDRSRGWRPCRRLIASAGIVC